MVGPSTSSRRRALLTGTDSGRDALRRIVVALSAVVVGTVGYVALGFPLLNAVYQTVTTVATVGFREERPLGPGGQAFTIVLILLGVGTVDDNLGVLVEAVTEGHLREHLRRRRMEHDIAAARPRHRLRVRTGRALQEDLDTVARELNGRPRQTLGWANPADTLTKYLVNGEPF